jgi:nucleolar MIF4G domain-containing protein 1
VQNKQSNGRRQFQPKPKPEAETELEGDESPPPPPVRPVPARPRTQEPLRSILKKTQPEAKVDARSESPPPLISRATKSRLAQDDAEIAALEKKLGIKGKGSKSKSDDDDGLDDLFGDLDALDSGEDTLEVKPQKRKRGNQQDDEWLANKRRKALGSVAEKSSDEDEEESGDPEEFDDSDLELGGTEGFDSEKDEDDDDNKEEEDSSQSIDDEEGFDSHPHDEQPQPRVRENPYIAPVTANTAQPTKYVPPALRAPPSSDAEALARLRRQMQGLFNRLSDANMLTILRDFEQIYQNNPRGYVNTTLIDLLMGMLADEAVLLDTFLILHAGFITAIYKVIGTDFAAQMIERIVAGIDQHYPMNKEGSGKQTTNLISVVAELYSFQVIGSNLVFDYIKLFLAEVSEINTELLLRMVKRSGTQLRQDDPTSLKDIVLLLQKSVAQVGEDKLPVRTKFMIETINNLKNNRMKTGVAASATASEHTIRMKKQLGSLNTRNLKGTEPLRIGLADIRNTEKKGKWWQVGASWRNDATASQPEQEEKGAESNTVTIQDIGDEREVDLLQLAKEQRMNTDIRRAIFITIMSATDFKDAHMRLLKLNLKKSQETEIPRVIVHCAGCEKTYNPYYTLLARKFCTDHKSRKCLQFALWDVFKSLGEKNDEVASDDEQEEDAHEDTSLRRLVNLGKLYGTLIAREGLSITSLKPLDFPYLKAKTKTFIEILLVTVILESQKGAEEGRKEKRLLEIFINADVAPDMVPGLQYFLQKVVSKTKIIANSTEKDTVKWACKTVGSMFTRLMETLRVDEE